MDLAKDLINYAKENGVKLLLPSDSLNAEENDLPYVLLDNNSIFKIVLEKLKNS